MSGGHGGHGGGHGGGGHGGGYGGGFSLGHGGQPGVNHGGQSSQGHGGAYAGHSGQFGHYAGTPHQPVHGPFSGLVSHLLGLDHHHPAAHSGEGTDHTPQASISWTSPWQGLKFSDVLQGINITTNSLFLILFLFFGIWLFVVYFVRHNEPLAAQVLGGERGAYITVSPTDQLLIEGVHKALPVRTSAAIAGEYTPESKLIRPQNQQWSSVSLVSNKSPAYLEVPPTGYKYLQSGSELLSTSSNHNLCSSKTVNSTSDKVYYIQEATHKGERLLTVVNR